MFGRSAVLSTGSSRRQAPACARSFATGTDSAARPSQGWGCLPERRRTSFYQRCPAPRPTPPCCVFANRCRHTRTAPRSADIERLDHGRPLHALSGHERVARRVQPQRLAGPQRVRTPHAGAIGADVRDPHLHHHVVWVVDLQVACLRPASTPVGSSRPDRSGRCRPRGRHHR